VIEAALFFYGRANVYCFELVKNYKCVQRRQPRRERRFLFG